MNKALLSSVLGCGNSLYNQYKGDGVDEQDGNVAIVEVPDKKRRLIGGRKEVRKDGRERTA